MRITTTYQYSLQLGQLHSCNLSQLPGEYTAPLLQWRTEGYFKHNIKLPSLGEQKQIVKHLTQGHRCNDGNSNPHSDDLTTRT